VRADGEKVRIRSSLIVHYRQMRETNHVAATVTDVSFLGQGLGDMLGELGFDHLELSVSAGMSPRKEKKDGARSVAFPPSAFDSGGTTRGDIV